MMDLKGMNIVKIFDSEYELMNIIWDKNPVRTRELVAKAEQKRGWKRTTVYTMVNRLKSRGILEFEDSIVTALYSRQDIQRMKTAELIQKYYGGDAEVILSHIRELVEKEKCDL